MCKYGKCYSRIKPYKIAQIFDSHQFVNLLAILKFICKHYFDMQGRTLNIFLSTALFSLTTVITFTLQNSCCQAEQKQHFGKVYSSYPYHNDFPIHCPHSSVSRKGNSRNSLCSRHFTRHSSHLLHPDQIKLSPTSKSTVGALSILAGIFFIPSKYRR